MRSVSIRLEDLCKITIPIGFAGENLRTTVRIDCMKMFQDYPDAIATLSVKPPEGKPYPTVVTRDGDIVVWEVTSSDLASQGYGEIQLSFLVDDVVAKSFVGKTRVDKSILPTGQAPDPIKDWIVRAEAALEGIPATIQAALEEAKESGEFDGFSPTANVTKEGNTATITITDKEGTTTATVSDGDYTNLIDDTSGSGTTDKTWSADKLTTELAKKEDKPELIATYTITMDYDTGDITATCDKTADEIGQVYDSGKKVEAIMIVDGFSQKAQLSVVKQGNMYACIASVTSIFEGVFYICAFSFSGNDEVQAIMYDPMISANGRDYTALNKKIKSLADPTDAKDATTKGYVDTALSAKEDKPYVVTFDLVIGTDSERFEEVVCNKTNAEILSAYESGKTIKAFANVYPEGSANLSVTSELSTIAMMPVGNGIYMIAIGGRIANFMGSTSYADILLRTMSVQPSWGIEYFPIYNEIIDDTAGAGTTTFTWSADKLVSELDLKAPKANPEFTGSISFERKAGSTVGVNSVAIGKDNEASGSVAYAEGYNTVSSGSISHTEGSSTRATANYSHAEGYITEATGGASHAEGNQTVASSGGAHAEGYHTIANNMAMHASGLYNIGDTSLPEFVPGNSYEVGDKIRRSGYSFECIEANTDSSWVKAHWKQINRSVTEESTLFVIGNGDENNRSNAMRIDWDGNEELSGDLTIKKGSADEVSVSELAEDVGDLKSAVNGKQDKPGFTANFTLEKSGEYWLLAAFCAPSDAIAAFAAGKTIDAYVDLYADSVKLHPL